MIDKAFWQEVNKAWTKDSKTKFVYTTGMGGAISEDLKSFGGMFDEIETDGDVEFDLGSGGFFESTGSSSAGSMGPSGKEPETKVTEKRPKLDTERFMALIEGQTLTGFSEACKLLIGCKLPAKMEDVYQNLADEMMTLQDAIIKFKGIYTTDLTEFYEYYIPETLELASAYIEYVEADVDRNIISETEDEVMQSSEKLLIALSDKKNEIYKYGSIELKARAQAVDAMMSQNGHVSPEYRL